MHPIVRREFLRIQEQICLWGVICGGIFFSGKKNAPYKAGNTVCIEDYFLFLERRTAPINGPIVATVNDG